MWIQVTTKQGDRETQTYGLVAASEDSWLAGFKRKFHRVEIHMTTVEFKRPITHAWVALQVLPRLSKHGELRIEVKP